MARELVLRLASLLWRLRRATAIETDLLEIQAEALRERRLGGPPNRTQEPDAAYSAFESTLCPGDLKPVGNTAWADHGEKTAEQHQPDRTDCPTCGRHETTRQLAYCFLRLANLDSGVFERLNRYEAALWRQTVQTLFALHPIRQR